MQRTILHVDMDAFFAAIEQREHPEYRGKPVIVGGLSSRGVVATASYEARRSGVHSAMPMETARRRCPDGIFVQGNYALYRAVSAEIFAIFSRYSPLVEPLSIDEAFLDVTGMGLLAPSPRVLAQKLKAEIREKTALVASVGIAPDSSRFAQKMPSGASHRFPCAASGASANARRKSSPLWASKPSARCSKPTRRSSHAASAHARRTP